jgi:GntR family transcriptional repressor for pyruvate dehydrogenase complex
MLSGISSQTIRARVWRGNVEQAVIARTIAQHEDILRALRAHDATLAEAAAVIHVATTEAWIRSVVDEGRWHQGQRSRPPTAASSG